MDERETALIFKAFGDENRIRIINLLSEQERSATELLEELSIVQSTLSHHMKILVESGIVSAETEGKWTYYSIHREGVEHAEAILHELARTSYFAKSRESIRRQEGWNRLVSFID